MKKCKLIVGKSVSILVDYELDKKRKIIYLTGVGDEWDGEGEPREYDVQKLIDGGKGNDRKRIQTNT